MVDLTEQEEKINMIKSESKLLTDEINGKGAGFHFLSGQGMRRGDGYGSGYGNGFSSTDYGSSGNTELTVDSSAHAKGTLEGTGTDYA
jgi:hypothetical protein